MVLLGTPYSLILRGCRSTERLPELNGHQSHPYGILQITQHVVYTVLHAYIRLAACIDLDVHTLQPGTQIRASQQEYLQLFAV